MYKYIVFEFLLFVYAQLYLIDHPPPPNKKIIP